MQHAPQADWLRRFASHALKLNPLTFPLDAMRNALFAHSELGDLGPEEAAERCWSESQGALLDDADPKHRARRDGGQAMHG